MTAALGLGLENVEDQIAFAQGGGVADAEFLGEADEVAAGVALELSDIERGRGRAILTIGGDGLFRGGWGLRCACDGNDPLPAASGRSTATGEMGVARDLEL